MTSVKKVLFNTTVLYAKLIIAIVVGIFTTRILVDALGVTDYGIYILVAGVIGMLSFMQSVMSTASMRYIAISLGLNDEVVIKKTFNSTLIIHFLLGIILSIIMEVAGFLMFDQILNIPEAKIYEAKVVYHFMVITTFISIVSVPYDALMSAHENFFAISLIDIIYSFLNLAIAIFIQQSATNVLIKYGFLVLINIIIVRIIKQWYCNVNYQESKIHFNEYIDKKIIKSILSFAGWKIFDSGASILAIQLRNIFLNIFFGLPLNTANGIATQLTSQVNNFSNNLTTAINPQIMKSEGGGDRQRMLQITAVSAKFSLFVFAIFALPVIIETPYLLSIWLKNVPDYTSILCRLIIFEMFLQKFTFPLTIAIQAVGKIRAITIVVTISLFLQLLISYYLYTIGYPPETIYLIGILFNIVSASTRLYFGNKLIGLQIKEYIYSVFFRGSLPLVIAAVFSLIPLMLMNEGLFRFICTLAISFFSTLLFIRFFGLTQSEYLKLKSIIISSISKFKK